MNYTITDKEWEAPMVKAAQLDAIIRYVKSSPYSPDARVILAIANALDEPTEVLVKEGDK